MRRLQIKFPNQIRISGWDFGSSARAMNQAGGKDSLMTYERELATQAVRAKYARMTFERKSMSTKTTIKRIALVAVSALGLGVLTSVAPASATAGAASAITAGTVAPARVGVNLQVAVTLTLPTGFSGTEDTMTIGAKIISAPTGSTFNTIATAASSAGDTPVVTGATVVTGRTAAGNLYAGKIGWTSPSTGANLSVAAGTGEASDSTNVLAGGTDYLTAAAYVTDATYNATTNTTATVLLNITPDVAGSYTVLLHTSARNASAGSANLAYVAGDTSSQFTFTTAGAPTSVTLSPVNSSTTDGTNGSIIKVTLKDAAGNATVLGANEGLSITDSSSSATTVEYGSSDTAIGPEDFTAGVAYIGLTTSNLTADLDVIVTVTGSGLIPATVTTNTTISVYDAAYTIDSFALDSTAAGYYEEAVSGVTGTTEYSTNLSSHTFAISASADGDDDDASTGADYVSVSVYDAYGVNTGVAAATYDLPAEILDGDDVGEITISAATGGLAAKTFLIGDGGSYDVALMGATAAQTTTTATNSVVRVAVGGSVTLKATTYNQFVGAMPSQTVNISVSGRNAAAAIATASDANGQVSITITDAATATGTTSTVTFDAAAGTDATTTIYWGDVTVSTVTVTGGASEDTVAYPAAGATTAAISTAVAGAAGSYTTFTATVKDASGNLISGVPVTWTVDKATAGIVKSASTDYASCITGTAGTCTTRVFAWSAPTKVTVTATAGGKTGTGYQNFVNAAADARVLSGSASGNVVTAKVVDRYGNAVAGVTVTAKTSSGYFGSGSTSTSGVTDENGEVGFAVTGGNATVTLKVDSAVYTQTDDAAGKVGTTAVTASVAGTTTGTGASLSPAGVNSVSVETSAAVATSDAIDAANEATDAANAATDAANAAAEAADAATAAAQDAQAAVAELATKVASLIAGIKAQITTLTNLVIKIQKKVRA